MELRRYWAILRQWAWLIVVGLVASLLASALFATTRTPLYESRTRVVVGPTLNSQDSSFDVLRSATQLVLTYRELITTPPMLDRTINTLGLDESSAELAKRISVSSNDVTRLLTIRVLDADPERAAAIANTLADVLILQNGSQQVGTESQLTVIEAAVPNDSAVSPNVPLILIFGGIGALLCIGAVIVISEVNRGHVRTEDDVHEITQAPSLGTIRVSNAPRHSTATGAPTRNTSSPDPYELVGTKLLAGVDRGEAGYTIAVCAPRATRHAAMVAAKLAEAIAQSGRTTLLIDGDISQRQLTHYFSLNGDEGFADLVTARSVVDDDHTRTPPTRQCVSIDLFSPRDLESLLIVPGGSIAGGPTSSDRLRETLGALQRIPAVTIVSGPSLASDSDALVLAQGADVVVLVSTANQTLVSDLRASVENLRLINARDVWTVLLTDRSVLPWRRRAVRPQAQVVASTMTLEAERHSAAEPVVA